MVRFALLALVLVSASACEGGASKAKEAVKKVDKVADKLDTDEAGAHLTAAGQAFANGKEAPEACSWASSSAASNVAESARGSVEQLRKMCAVEPPLIRAAAAVKAAETARAEQPQAPTLTECQSDAWARAAATLGGPASTLDAAASARWNDLKARWAKACP